jgi:hypothetical protein
MVSYKTEVYKATKAYTSHSNVSVAEFEKINATNYDNIPTEIEVGTELVILYDAWGGFIPSYSAYENPGQLWSHSKKTDWYTHTLTGVKVKKEVIKTPDYDKPNGNGSCTTTLTVKIPLPDARGTHPNSYNNRVYLGISKDIKLTEDQWEVVKKLGHGKGYSEGIRNLLKKV